MIQSCNYVLRSCTAVMIDPWHTCAVRVMVLGLCMCVGNGRAKKPVCKSAWLRVCSCDNRQSTDTGVPAAVETDKGGC